MPNAPAASCALCSWSMHTSIHSGGTGYIRHSPRNGFTAYSVLSPGTGLSCPRRPRDEPATLTPASGRQDHTPSPFASVSLVSRHCHVHRIPLPTSVTIAIRPSCGGGTAGRIHSFRFSESEIFVRGEPTTRIGLNRFNKFQFTRARFGNEKTRCPKQSSEKSNRFCPSDESVCSNCHLAALAHRPVVRGRPQVAGRRPE